MLLSISGDIVKCILQELIWSFIYFTTSILQEWFAVYVELNQQIAALLNAGDEEDLVELKSLQQQLSDVCYRQASQLEFRQNLLQAALEFHGVAQDVSVYSDCFSFLQIIWILICTSFLQVCMSPNYFSGTIKFTGGGNKINFLDFLKNFKSFCMQLNFFFFFFV